VILDLRTDSPTFGKTVAIELTGTNYKAVYLPIGVAHGFCVLEDFTSMIYLCSTVHSASCDAGVRYDSFDFQWPIEQPILSDRDLAFPTFSELVTPFII